MTYAGARDFARLALWIFRGACHIMSAGKTNARESNARGVNVVVAQATC